MCEVYKKDDIILYDKLKHDHICYIIHHGSAPKMELEGVERIFGRSINKNKIRYTEYYGDGDTKSFSAVEIFMVRNQYQNVNVLDMFRNGLRKAWFK